MDRLREALEPFANAHNRRPVINDQHPDYDKELVDEQAGITWGDLRKAHDVLSLLTSTLESGDYVRVPREPTQAMREAGFAAALDNIGGDVIGTIEVQSWITRAVWSAMISASPTSKTEA